ncbi:response regulator transcription factor [Actinomadura sp. 21ATH]|uniref:response regulator transcription factor n=1 Tax=Actinomadura sp. 21ATH TaxID=1735444 RepID=UPI0035C19C48
MPRRRRRGRTHPPGVIRRLIARLAGGGPHPAPAVPPHGLAGVTAREREVLTLVGRGLTNAEIAAELHLSMATVKTYVARLLTRLDARDRVQLVIIAYESGLLGPGTRPA